MWGHREVLGMLSRAEFHVRYKRASFGVAWAVAVPLVQAGVLAIIFSRLIHVSSTKNFGAFVLAGVLAWSYFSQGLIAGSTAIVDGANLTDKVWFPRALLPLVSVLSNVPGLLVSMVLLVLLMPLLGTPIEARILLLIPGCLLLVLFTAALSTCLSALHVYFRDVKFLVQAAILVWFYVTPIAYPKNFLHGLASVIDFNPMTGIVTVFQEAVVGPQPGATRAIVIAVVCTVVLTIVAIEAQRRHDRLFVDRL